MKIAVIFLDYLRHDHTQRTLQHNSERAGYPYDMICVDRLGVSAALNEGIRAAEGYDAVFTMANDILMPDQWLAQLVYHAERIPETGTCGFHTVEAIGGLTNRGGLDVHEWPVAFGNVFIPKGVIDEIGGFNQALDPYSVNDADFAYRATKMGYIHYYIQGARAEHIGHDVGSISDYRKLKDESLGKGSYIYQKLIDEYERRGIYYIDPAVGFLPEE